MVEQKEFPKITEQELDRLRQFQGIPLPVKEPFNRYATIDTIAHFAQGMGTLIPCLVTRNTAREAIGDVWWPRRRFSSPALGAARPKDWPESTGCGPGRPLKWRLL